MHKLIQLSVQLPFGDRPVQSHNIGTLYVPHPGVARLGIEPGKPRLGGFDHRCVRIGTGLHVTSVHRTWSGKDCLRTAFGMLSNVVRSEGCSPRIADQNHAP